MKTLRTKTEELISKAFNLPAIERSRLPWVDYLRGISIILIAYRHVLIGIDRSGLYVPPYLMTANMIFFSFRLPLFFILSGIFLNASLKKRTIKQFIENKFEVLLYPYFVWAALQITIQIATSSFTNANRSWVDYTYLFYQPRELDQFWYLPALFNVTMIYLFVKKYLKPPVVVQYLIGLFFYFLSPHVQEISILSDWMLYYFFFAIGDSISSLFFKTSWQKVFQNPYTLLAVTPLFVGSQMYFLSQNLDSASADMIVQTKFIVIALIGCVSMFVLAFRVQALNIFPFLRVFGYHSLYIYIMHVMITAFVRIVLTTFFGIHNAEILLITGMAIGVTFSIAIYNLFIRNGIAWFLFTYKKPKSKPPTTSLKDLAPAAIAS